MLTSVSVKITPTDASRPPSGRMVSCAELSPARVGVLQSLPCRLLPTPPSPCPVSLLEVELGALNWSFNSKIKFTASFDILFSTLNISVKVLLLKKGLYFAVVLLCSMCVSGYTSPPGCAWKSWHHCCWRSTLACTSLKYFPSPRPND